jgi:hypothetical protein
LGLLAFASSDGSDGGNFGLLDLGGKNLTYEVEGDHQGAWIETNGLHVDAIGNATLYDSLDETQIVSDRIQETTATTGTGTYDLGGAKEGFAAFSSAFSSGVQVPYCVTDDTDWEIGLGTFIDGTPGTISRDIILASSNSGAAVDWVSTNKSIFCTACASLFPAMRNLNPPINFNPPTPGFQYINKLTGEIFICTDNTADSNRWVGQLGTLIG